MDKVIKNKRGLELVTSPSQVMKLVQKNSFVIIWPLLMMQCEAVFELFWKLHLQIYASQIMTS